MFCAYSTLFRRDVILSAPLNIFSHASFPPFSYMYWIRFFISAYCLSRSASASCSWPAVVSISPSFSVISASFCAIPSSVLAMSVLVASIWIIRSTISAFIALISDWICCCCSDKEAMVSFVWLNWLSAWAFCCLISDSVSAKTVKDWETIITSPKNAHTTLFFM